MKKFVIVFCTIVYSCFQCYAQITRDTILLKGIEVHASPMVRFSVGSIPDLIKTGNSNDPVNSQLGDFIQCNSNAIVRQASFGSSSSISLRGSSAGQVAVMWNGFNVNSPSLGTMDVSLIPFESGNEITIYNSGMSPHSGQTGLGGLLEINFNPNFSENEIFRLSTSYGDFETIESKLKFRYAGKRFLSESNVFYTASENNYTYRNVALADQPIESLDHSRYTYGGLIQNFQYKIDAKNTFQGGIWIQRTNRDLPAPMTIPKSNAVQNDSTMRSFVSYQRGSETKNIKIGFAYFDERQHFADPDVLVDSRHRNRQYQGELSTTQRLPADVLIRIGIKTEFQKSDIAEYGEEKKNDFNAIFLNALKHFQKGPSISLSARKVYSSSFHIPFTYSLGLKQNIYKQQYFVLINGGYNYRVPTLNDRYWIPGGNTSLKPEDSKNVEVNLLADLTKEYSLNFSGGGFYRITDNWIQWTPAKSGVWSPVNIKTVSTSGLNLKFQLAAPISKVVKIYFRSGYTFTSAINKEVQLNSLSATEGKQLTYTPMHTAYGTISTSYNGWIISSTNYYSGRRFTTEENTLFLESYILHDLQLIRKFQFRRTGLQLHIRANNIWDQIYTLQPYMPTRGRWIQGGLTFTFKNKDYEKDN